MTHQGNRIAAGDEKKVADHILFAEMCLPRFGKHTYWEQEQNESLPIVPLEPRLKQTGPRRIEFTYRWRASRAVERDYQVFVHFTNPDASQAEQIVFQHDHPPTTPTPQWEPDTIVCDGPHELEIPADFTGTAKIHVGLPADGQRASLSVPTPQRQRYLVGAIEVAGDNVTLQPARAVAPPELWSRGDGGWTENLCRTDRAIKNVWEVLSPLNRITAERPLGDHRFLTPDRLVQQTAFGETTITVAYEKEAHLGDNIVPPHGFIVESREFVAFCATRFNGVEYKTPTLFTARSLDGKAIRNSRKVRIYHGFGDTRLRLFDRDFQVDREKIMSFPPAKEDD